MNWDKSSITTLLLTNDKALYRAITVIFDRQTAEEQSSETTSVNNGIGFSGCDAQILSSFAKQIAQRGFLSPKQKEIAVKKMPKYHKQIITLIKEKEARNV